MSPQKLEEKEPHQAFLAEAHVSQSLINMTTHPPNGSNLSKPTPSSFPWRSVRDNPVGRSRLLDPGKPWMPTCPWEEHQALSHTRKLQLLASVSWPWAADFLRVISEKMVPQTSKTLGGMQPLRDLVGPLGHHHPELCWLRMQTAKVQIPTPSVISCVTLGSRFPYL